MATLKIGSTGEFVRTLQDFLNIPVDGSFGPKTEEAVRAWQKKNGLLSDGIVGPKTWDTMGLATTDLSERLSEIATNGPIPIIDSHFLAKGQYKNEITNKEYLFIHHTAGWHNPYKVIDAWGIDDRGCIAVEFVIGGKSIKGNDNTSNGKIVQAFPTGYYGWHLGSVKSAFMHSHSVGIELCNFGWLKDGKTYTGNTVVEDQIINLAVPFRDYSAWHRYSDEQIESLRQLILYIANRDSIDVRNGLPKWVAEKGVKAFDYNQDACEGKIRGLLSHGNVRIDKTDVFPQPELLDMLLTI